MKSEEEIRAYLEEITPKCLECKALCFEKDGKWICSKCGKEVDDVVECWDCHQSETS